MWLAGKRTSRAKCIIVANAGRCSSCMSYFTKKPLCHRHKGFFETGRCSSCMSYFTKKPLCHRHSASSPLVNEPMCLAKKLTCLAEGNNLPANTKTPTWPVVSIGRDENCINNVNEPWRNALPQQSTQNGQHNSELKQHEVRSVSLAKGLACLLDEDSGQTKRKDRGRMELKRSIEMRIKKRVKEQQLSGKFYDLMEKVISEAATLQDSYDIIRINSNIDLGSAGDDICFVSMSRDLRSGNYDAKSDTFSFFIRAGGKESLVLPNLKLRIVQEAIRVVLEVVYRPSFSKISHGCRSGRGPRSALRYICHEIGKTDWWFTFHMKKKCDAIILSNLISTMEEKIEDTKLFSFIQHLFDAKVLNLEFGGFPKGQGLPQEGALSPVLMNIYLNNLDSQLFRMFMRYEGLGLNAKTARDREHSKLRSWFRMQIKESNTEEAKVESGLRLHACRYMDEIFVAISGSRDIALNLRNEIQNYIKHSLFIELVEQNDIVTVNSCSCCAPFLGMVVRASSRESEAVRAVHKLKDKVRLFAAQRQEIWNAGMVRIGKKWLAHGLKRLKESEIKQLGISNPTLDQVSRFRKEGMKTEHWFNTLIKIWLEDINVVAEADEEATLCKYIAEPALPQELRDSFYNFQRCAEEYVSSETVSTLALLSDRNINSEPYPATTKVEAPVSVIHKKLLSYGLVNAEGFPRHVSRLILQDDTLIVHWFSGLVSRWVKWYVEHENFKDIKLIMVKYIKKSCIRTLSAKHRMHEGLIENRFELELNNIPLTEDLETDIEAMPSDPTSYDNDEALTYGIFNSGICILSPARVGAALQPLRCFALGCLAKSSSMYTLHVKDQQKFPGWKTGFATGIHLSLDRERIALCNQHVRDLYLGHISLQSIEFGLHRSLPRH